MQPGLCLADPWCSVLCVHFMYPIDLLTRLSRFSVIIEKADLTFWFDDFPTEAMFTQRGDLTACLY